MFGEGSNGTQKIAVSEFALQNILRIDAITDKLSLGNDVSDSFPFTVFSSKSFPDRFWAGSKVSVVEFLVVSFIFFDKLLVVGFYDFFYNFSSGLKHELFEILRIELEDFDGGVVSKFEETHLHAGKQVGSFESIFISDSAFVVLVLVKFFPGDLLVSLKGLNGFFRFGSAK